VNFASYDMTPSSQAQTTGLNDFRFFKVDVYVIKVTDDIIDEQISL